MQTSPEPLRSPRNPGTERRCSHRVGNSERLRSSSVRRSEWPTASTRPRRSRCPRSCPSAGLGSKARRRRQAGHPRGERRCTPNLGPRSTLLRSAAHSRRSARGWPPNPIAFSSPVPALAKSLSTLCAAGGSDRSARSAPKDGPSASTKWRIRRSRMHCARLPGAELGLRALQPLDALLPEMNTEAEPAPLREHIGRKHHEGLCPSVLGRSMGLSLATVERHYRHFAGARQPRSRATRRLACSIGRRRAWASSR